MTSRLMLSISGIRGVIGETLTPELICKYTASFYTLQLSKTKKKQIIVGSDTRPAVGFIKHCIFGTLIACGAEVIDLGVVPTPTVQLIVQSRNSSGGIVVTASHNPQEWCGLKFVESSGLFLDQKNCDILFSNVQSSFVTYNLLGSIIQDSSAIDFHIDQILNLPSVDANLIKGKEFKVVVDTINGAGSIAVPKLLRTLGCKVTEINTEPTGIFAHQPEPLPENLTELREKSKNFDVGIAIDPDSDRCVLIDETGNPLIEEYTLALSVYLMLKYNNVRAPICRNISTTRAIDDICSQFGVTVYGTKIGEINVAEKMVEVQSIIGGEGNGGVMLKDIHIGRDALVAVALTLQLMALEGKKISEIKASLPQWRISKRKVVLQNVASKIEAWVALMKSKFQDEIKFNTIDGVRIDHNDWWIHVRSSNTEPVVRVISEARTQEKADALSDEASKYFSET